MESNRSEHIVEEKLEAYALNQLREEDLEAVEEHLLVCGTCQDRLDEVERYAHAMRGAARRIQQEERLPASLHASFWDRLRGWFSSPVPAWGTAFATVGLILMIGLSLGRQANQPPGPPVDVELQAVRGPVPPNVAEAGHALRLRLDSRGVQEMPAWPIEIVDAEGGKVWNGTGSWSDTWIRTSVDRSFRPGMYYVRLLKDGETIREYQLTVHGTK
jgi:hypothetical protein